MAPSAELEKFTKENGLDLEKRQKDRGTAIHRAVFAKRPAIVEELLDLYPEDCLDAKNRESPNKGRTPLHNAAQMGLHPIVQKLIIKGAQVDARSKLKWTALIFATQNNRREIVGTLLKNGADVNAKTGAIDTEKGRGELTALHLAAELWSAQVTLKLLISGADANARTANGDTPLHFAIRAGSISSAAILLFHGAFVTAENVDGVTIQNLLEKLSKPDRRRFDHVFSCASAEGNHKEFLRNYPNPDVTAHITDAIHWAIEKNMDKAVAYLVHSDPYVVEARSPQGWHPLHRAARRGFNTCLDTLLQHGAELNSLNNQGWTPLMLAARYDNTEIVEILLGKEADRTAKNDAGENALQIAQKHGHRRTALLLAVRHIPSSEGIGETITLVNQLSTLEMKKLEAAKGGNLEASRAQSNKNELLKPPKSPRRTSSPSLSQEKVEIQGELFALSDAAAGNESKPAPENEAYIEKFFTNLELTWYNRIQWTPDDDDEGTTQSDFRWSGPVKIAVLDTGLDLGHEDFSNPARRRSKNGQKAAKRLPEKAQRDRIKGIRNFVGNPGEEQDVTDDVGHGTHIAGLIMAVAPRAELYIAKVSKSAEGSKANDANTSPSKQGRRKYRRPVEEAIQWAIDQGVDIINLSMGFPHQGSYELNSILDEAAGRNIIVFAAAANHGNREAIAWPARDPDLTICVSSGDEYNNLSRFAPRPSQTLPVFIAPGEDVWSQWPTNLGGGFRKMSGTSVSTPIVVGMAAMVLAFLNKTNAWSPSEKAEWLDPSIERKIRRTRGMRVLLEYICRDRHGVKILSPHLMWEENLGSNPLQALARISEPFRLQG